MSKPVDKRVEGKAEAKSIKEAAKEVPLVKLKEKQSKESIYYALFPDFNQPK